MKRIYYWLMNLLFPPKCVLCRRLLKRGETDLCKSCRIDAPLYPNCKRKLQFLDSYAAVWYYEGNVRSSILRFKFEGTRSYAASYGRFLAMMLMEEYPDGFDILTWIPVSPLRLLSRGYDQAQLLAQAAGKELGMRPVRLLKKVRHNTAQSGLRDIAQRKANALGAYRFCPGEDITGKRILLLDDIITTGATASEAARVLLTAGAGEVHCAAVAARKE